MIEYEYGFSTHQGAREYQEDTCKHFPMRSSKAKSGGSPGSSHAFSLLAVLCDGMGGHAGGARASSSANSVFWEAYKANLKDDTVDRNRQALREALKLSNAGIAQIVAQNPNLQGMGCTLVAVRFHPDGMLWLSVGDSPLYLIQGGPARRINQDHSLAPMLDNMVSSGELTAEAAYNHPQRNALRSAVMGSKIELVDDERKDFLPLSVGDWVIIASDGIQSLTEAQITHEVHRHHARGAQAVADALVKAVLEQQVPYQDNVTVMVVTPYEVDRAGVRLAPKLRLSGGGTERIAASGLGTAAAGPAVWAAAGALAVCVLWAGYALFSGPSRPPETGGAIAAKPAQPTDGQVPPATTPVLGNAPPAPAAIPAATPPLKDPKDWTSAETRKFQREHGLTVDGDAGPQVRRKFEELNTPKPAQVQPAVPVINATPPVTGPGQPATRAPSPADQPQPAPNKPVDPTAAATAQQGPNELATNPIEQPPVQQRRSWW